MLISGRFRWISPAGCSCRGYGAQYELYGIAADGYAMRACARRCIMYVFAHLHIAIAGRQSVENGNKAAREFAITSSSLKQFTYTTVTATPQ
jgi:hypothetical protein